MLGTMLLSRYLQITETILLTLNGRDQFKMTTVVLDVAMSTSTSLPTRKDTTDMTAIRKLKRTIAAIVRHDNCCLRSRAELEVQD